jgi:hypothetical protein
MIQEDKRKSKDGSSKKQTQGISQRRYLHLPTVTGNSVENKLRLIKALTDLQALLSPFKALQMRSTLSNLSPSARSGHQTRAAFLNSGLTYRAPKQIVRGSLLWNNIIFVYLIFRKESICNKRCRTE